MPIRIIITTVLCTLFIIGVVSPVFAQTGTAPNLKVAFIGDTGYGSSFQGVLNLIKNEGAHMIVVQGDYSYGEGNDSIEGDADGYFALVDQIMGANYPIFGSVGNHEDESWPTNCPTNDGCFASHFVSRMPKYSGGVQNLDTSQINNEYWSATYKGMKMIFLGQEDSNSGPTGPYVNYVKQQMATSPHIWNICSFHKNGLVSPYDSNAAGQLGTKGQDMGPALYQTCIDLGAIVATAHEHSYSRTLTLRNVVANLSSNSIDKVQHPLGTVNGWPNVPSNPNSLIVAPGSPGKSFIFVSGLGGNSIRNQDRCSNKAGFSYPYGCDHEWAKIYTSDQGADFGALFITFNVNGNPHRAQAYFKTRGGQIVDSFEIIAQTIGSPSPTPNFIPGDTDQDNDVDFADYLNLISEFGRIDCTTSVCQADFDSDNRVNVFDFSILVSVFGTN